MKTIYRLAAATVALALAAAPASAQQGGANVQRAAAVVNDLVISTFDLDQRTRLVLSSAGGAQGPEAQARIREQVLRTLIDELLQLQEAEKAEISVGEKDVDEALARIAQQNNTTPQAILNSLAGAGVYAATLKNQIKAELAWSRLIEERLAPRVNLTDEEIDEEMRRIEAGATKPRFLVSEIFFAVDSPDDEARVRQNIERLFQQLQTGTPFPFWRSNSASRRRRRAAATSAGCRTATSRPRSGRRSRRCGPRRSRGRSGRPAGSTCSRCATRCGPPARPPTRRRRPRSARPACPPARSS